MQLKYSELLKKNQKTIDEPIVMELTRSGRLLVMAALSV
jgi:hypothetical protein